MDISYLSSAGKTAIQLSKYVSSLRDKLKYAFWYEEKVK